MVTTHDLARSTLAVATHRRLGPLLLFDGTIDEAADHCLDRIAIGAGCRVATANLDFVALTRHDRQLRADLAASHLVVADGAPVALLARLMGARRSRGRIAGVDLVRAVCDRAATSGLRIALYGADPLTAHRARHWIEARWPQHDVVLVLNPPYRALSEEERALEQAAIAEAAPELVLVALGCPAQERRIAEYFHAAPGAAWIGVGGTLDFFGGRRRRAPRWMQRIGGEWLFRLGQEPGRLGQRYLLRDVPALVQLLAWCARGAAAPHKATAGPAFNTPSTADAESDAQRGHPRTDGVTAGDDTAATQPGGMHPFTREA